MKLNKIKLTVKHSIATSPNGVYGEILEMSEPSFFNKSNKTPFQLPSGYISVAQFEYRQGLDSKLQSSIEYALLMKTSD